MSLALLAAYGSDSDNDSEEEEQPSSAPAIIAPVVDRTVSVTNDSDRAMKRRRVDDDSEAPSSILASATNRPRIAYSHTSPYAVHRPGDTGAGHAAAATSAREARLMQEFAVADESIVEVRQSELIGHSTLSLSTAAIDSHARSQSKTERKLSTRYWDAVQGRETVITGVHGRQKHKHQINALAIDAARLESELAQRRAQGAANRAGARQKYGW